MRAVLCASLCNCRHSLRAANDEELARAALVHVRQHHPAARLGEERIREIVFTRAYDVEFAAVSAGGIEPDEEFGLEPY
jgi:predicted small metal-binding protein